MYNTSFIFFIKLKYENCTTKIRVFSNYKMNLSHFNDILPKNKLLRFLMVK